MIVVQIHAGMPQHLPWRQESYMVFCNQPFCCNTLDHAQSSGGMPQKLVWGDFRGLWYLLNHDSCLWHECPMWTWPFWGRTGSCKNESICAREDFPQGLLIWPLVVYVQPLCLILTRGFITTQAKTSPPSDEGRRVCKPSLSKYISMGYGLRLPNLARADLKHSCWVWLSLWTYSPSPAFFICHMR